MSNAESKLEYLLDRAEFLIIKMALSRLEEKYVHNDNADWLMESWINYFEELKDVMLKITFLEDEIYG